MKINTPMTTTAILTARKVPLLMAIERSHPPQFPSDARPMPPFPETDPADADDDPSPDADGPAAPCDQILTAVAPGGTRLDRAFAGTAPDLSRTRLKTLIEAGAVSVDGRVVTQPAFTPAAGAQVMARVPAPEPARPTPEAMDLDVVYEDLDLIVLNKPAGLVVHPGAGVQAGTLVNGLLAHCGARLSGIGGVARPGIVHRLDRDTSGLMVVAKTDRAHRGLSAQFADRSLSRRYLAVVEGHPRPREGTVSAAIGRSARDRRKMAVVRSGAGKPAVTHYRVERRLGPGASLVRCRLETGRTHQIRVHMTHLGHRLVGDPVYGRPARGLPEPARGFPRQALHAEWLRFRHPETGAELAFERPPPADLRTLIGALDPENPSLVS